MTDTEAAVPAPRANPDLVGHEQAERVLCDGFDSGRLAHAWLIAGPPGIGKATLAFRFARFVLAGDKAESGGLFGDALPADDGGILDVDPDDPVFRRVASGGHSDLLTIERSVDPKRNRLRSEIIVDDVRRIGHFFAHAPAEGGWRVVVIDVAEEMNRHAANAVLKVLEEPPSKALLLLVSHAPGRLLPTIRSRCRLLTLSRLETDVVETLIARYRPDIAGGDRSRLARLADGSIGRAITLADHGGLALHGELMALLADVPRTDIEALHRFADRFGRAGGENAFSVVEDLLRRWLQRLIRCCAGAPPADGTIEDDEAALIARLAPAAGLDRWLEVWEKTSGLLGRVDSANLDRKQVFLNVFLGLERAVRP